jgi:hypothetical protein
MIEATLGDPSAAADRLKELQDIPILGISERALDLADELILAAALPAKAVRDAQHVGIAAVNGIDYLLTWNCRHLANVVLRDKIEDVCDRFGVRAPKICTPEELQGAMHDR